MLPSGSTGDVPAVKRRDFITLLGGAAAWPIAARAQQGDGVRRVGALSTLAESDLEVQSWIRELVQRLQELGWTNGRNVQVDFRFSDADAARTSMLAAKLIELRPDVVLASGALAATALRQQTLSIPIVFVHVVDPVSAGFVTKSEESYRLRLLLTQRRNLKRKFLDIENAIRHSIKTFGLKVGKVSRGRFEARVRELVAGDALIAGLTDCMLRARAALWQEYLRLHKVVVAVVRRDELCRRFMRIPGVGPISALAYKTAVDDPQRFRHSKTVGAYFGLTSRRWQSGTSIDVQGHISRAGDGEVRHPLYEAANIMLTRFRGFSSLKAWGLKIAKKRGHRRACVAVARKLAVIMHAMWRDGTEFRFKEPKPADSSVPAASKLIGMAA